MTALLSEQHVEAIRGATDFVGLQAATLSAARQIADAEGATFVLRDGEYCFYAAEDAIAPLWAGQRFPLTHCISGWAMRHATQTEVRDIELDERIPVEAYRPTFVRSLVMTPLGTVAPVGALGVYWCETGRMASAATLELLLELGREAAGVVDRLGLAAAPWAPNFALRTRP